ncbi:MAG: 23S rRNA (adenine(2503)-C(2))-methyltransferase RlmN [Nitrospiraceae bacterium]|nr:MAG: 23S rRNA (adenine(2503)-C(2))-methyltransferase RlmN [Nitrospiraceae bacterium]
MKKNFKELSQDEIILVLEGLGQKKYRARQIIDWIYKKMLSSFDEMTDLPCELREALKKTAYISNLHLLQEQESSDGTRRFLFELEDRQTIESVLIPNIRGESTFTLCISSQVGCAVGCAFCSTGKMGMQRNLKAHEIVEQVMAASKIIHIESACLNANKNKSGRITNIVFMGMGEPLNNFSEVVTALRKITGLLGFSKRKITVSTAGIVPKIYEFPQKAPEVNLAISLNATTDVTRNRLMPINKRYPLKDLLEACRVFPLSPYRRITFEYILIEGINDSREDAKRLVKLLQGIRSKVNLIPYNPPSLSQESADQLFNPSSDRTILEFQNVLHKAGVTAIIRKSMGSDISAACGQLKATYSMQSEQ